MKKLILILFFLPINILTAQNPVFSWARSVGGVDRDIGNAITTDEQGNVYTTGYCQDTVDFDPGPGVYNLISTESLFLLKLNSSGNLIWAKQIGEYKCVNTNSLCWVYPYSICLDNDGNVYTTGTFWGTIDFNPGSDLFILNSAGEYDGFILKLDSSGNFIWAKQMGGEASDRVFSICTDTHGNVYTTGCFEYTADFDPGPGINILNSNGIDDAFILKLDSSGNLLWAKNVGGDFSNNASIGISDYGYSIKTDIQGNVYVTGSFCGNADFDPGPNTYNINSAGYHDIFILKLDTSGNLLWVKQMGGVSSDHGMSLAIDVQSNVLISGDFWGTIDFDPGLGTTLLSSVGVFDIFIVKLDSTGNLIWAKKVGGIGDDRVYSLSTDSLGNVYTTGCFDNAADFNPGPGNYYLISAGNYDIFILKLDSMGDFCWAGRMGAAVGDFGNAINTDMNGNVYVTGEFDGTVDFDPGPGVFNISEKGWGDLFILKLSPDTTTFIAENQHIRTRVFPNPFSEQINLDVFAEKESNFNWSIYDILGRELLKDKKVVQSGNHTIHINSDQLPKGIYIMHVFCNEERLSVKLVKEQ